MNVVADNAPRVLQILEVLDQGGAEILVLDVLRQSAKLGLPMFAAALHGGTLEREFTTCGRPCIVLDRRLPMDVRVILKLRRLITDSNIEIVHCHQPVDGLHGYLAALGTSARVVLTFHGDPTYQKRRDIAVAKFLVPRVARNIAVSNAFYKSICQALGVMGRGRWSIVHNGIDLTRLLWSVTDIRANLGLPNGSTLLGMVGNFHPCKDHYTLVRAFKEVLRFHPHVHLLLVGGRSSVDPRPFEHCVRFVQDNGLGGNVHLLGRHPNAAEITRQLDYFVFATTGDTFALALVEAMMLGVPCVVAQTPEMVEVTGNDDYVTFYRPSDSMSLAEALKSVLKNKDEAIRKAVRARTRALKCYTIEAHIASLLELYNEVLHRSEYTSPQVK